MAAPDFTMDEGEEEIRPKGRMAPENLPTSYLLSAGYDGAEQKAYLRLYEPVTQQVYLWYDNTSHLPYCISREPAKELEKNQRLLRHEGYFFMEEVKKHDPLADAEIMVTKVVAKDPLSIGGGRGQPIRSIIGDSWESRIRYYQCYIYDRELITGMPYRVENGNLVDAGYTLDAETETKIDAILEKIEPEFRGNMKEWTRLLQCPVPKLRRVAVDIEVRPSVQNRLPNADEAQEPITAVGFSASDGFRRIIVLNDTGHDVPTPVVLGAEVKVYTDERDMIRETFQILDEYPVVLTFNGDDFDFRFMRNRAKNLGVPDSENPIVMGRRFAFLRNGVHLDLYKFFMNRSIQGYAFGNRYRENTLNEISKTLLNMEKLADRGHHSGEHAGPSTVLPERRRPHLPAHCFQPRPRNEPHSPPHPHQQDDHGGRHPKRRQQVDTLPHGVGAPAPRLAHPQHAGHPRRQGADEHHQHNQGEEVPGRNST